MLGGLFLTLSSAFGFMFGKSRVLSLLLLVEGGYLGVVCFMAGIMGMCDVSPFLIILMVGACEAGVMLGGVVKLVRSHGNDYVRSLGVYKC
uniref:NADH-ubiquinone oxidoreductase chain 4L n=1 Tax=Trisidos kiyonoi TaxID=935009 RepID=A0A1U9ALQ8_TRIKY|nr:NADH dehydrogenase subunit 4L [Trisidos kiyonoi]